MWAIAILPLRAGDSKGSIGCQAFKLTIVTHCVSKSARPIHLLGESEVGDGLADGRFAAGGEPGMSPRQRSETRRGGRSEVASPVYTTGASRPGVIRL